MLKKRGGIVVNVFTKKLQHQGVVAILLLSILTILPKTP